MKYNTPSLVAAILGPLIVAADCTHNNCLRAVIGEAFPTRDGLGDCGSYLRVTVTPATVTFTATATISTGIVISSTETDEFTVTLPTTVSTETDVALQTNTIEEISTLVETVTTTTTVDPYVTAAPQRVVIAKRQATVSGSTFPAYASACSSFAKYSSACSCLGVFASTITVAAPSTTVTITATSTSTSLDISTVSTTETDYSSVTATTLVTSTVLLTTTDASTTTTTTLVVQATPLVNNGGFESGSLNPWVVDYPRTVSGSVTSGGPSGSSTYKLVTGNLYDNNLFQLHQTLTSAAGTVWTCSYDWYFTRYYETRYSNGKTYVPYVHVYIGDDIVSNRQPSSTSAASWQTASFTFTSTGSDILYFDVASPQPQGGRTGGSNTFYLDNVACVQSS
ncbi:hypothetical protein NKR23_g6486 [Pleurostoma richardsiae]|uniref:CBM-cenC domain-containing protein n=1 Tax=Pleurostoma richardsiae TaxID=41990 RepID=A0AA38VSA2_9PEZI|nr:hypothetical protein NKR23_g6486 [Pleurostoma richardsiae]